ncbi:MAG TPA: LysR family transcriptional regulator [Micromonosporaceae bacterium]|nr:LysR family transcriptional regulator [Micromonosporaceae bacterium]
MNLELRHLRVVCAIAETGSVTKAASLLGLAQPALTAQLQRIERTLGGPLFDRDRRGATPTALGELVLARARVVLPAMKGLQDEAARLAGSEATPSRYRIGAVNGPILGGMMSRAATENPDVQLSPYPSWSTDELAELVVTGRLDFCLAGVCGDTMPGTPADGLTWRVVAIDAVFVLLPERHPLADRFEIHLAELADAMWVSSPGDGCFGDCFAAACSREGFTPRTMYEMDIGGCIDLVQEGHAVGLCQATFRRVHGLVAVPIAGAPLRWRHLLGWHPESAAASFAGAALAHAVAAYEDSAARNPRYAHWLTLNPKFGAQLSIAQ